MDFLAELGHFRALSAETPVGFELAETTLLRALEEEVLGSPTMYAYIYESLSSLMLRKRDFDQVLKYNRFAYDNRRKVSFVYQGLSAEQLGQIRHNMIQAVSNRASEAKYAKNWYLSNKEIQEILEEQPTFGTQ